VAGSTIQTSTDLPVSFRSTILLETRNIARQGSLFVHIVGEFGVKAGLAGRIAATLPYPFAAIEGASLAGIVSGKRGH
jgi:hypothetical protein